MQPRGSVINEICSLYDSLSERDRRVADFVMANQLEVPSMTTREIAQGSSVSAATVSRFVRRLGYESFSSLRYAIQRDNADARAAVLPSHAVSLSDPAGALQTVMMAKAQELQDTITLLDERQLVRAVQLIERSASVVFGAVGNTIPAALSASFLIAQLGLRAHCAPTTEAMMLESLLLTPRDVVVFISKSGHSKRLNTMMDNALDSDTPTVVITNQPASPLARRATCVLHAATRDKVLSSDLPFSHNSINYIVEVLFLLLSSDVPNLRAHADLLWKSLGEDKGVSGEVF